MKKRTNTAQSVNSYISLSIYIYIYKYIYISFSLSLSLYIYIYILAVDTHKQRKDEEGDAVVASWLPVDDVLRDIEELSAIYRTYYRILSKL